MGWARLAASGWAAAPGSGAEAAALARYCRSLSRCCRLHVQMQRAVSRCMPCLLSAVKDQPAATRPLGIGCKARHNRSRHRDVHSPVRVVAYSRGRLLGVLNPSWGSRPAKLGNLSSDADALTGALSLNGNCSMPTCMELFTFSFHLQHNGSQQNLLGGEQTRETGTQHASHLVHQLLGSDPAPWITGKHALHQLLQQWQPPRKH